MKKCPYHRVKSTQVFQRNNDLVDEETGIIKSIQDVTIDTYILMDCLEEKCGAYFDGRCNYRV